MKRFIPALIFLLLAACGGDGLAPDGSGIAARRPNADAVGVSVATTVRVTFARDVQLGADPATTVWLERENGDVVPMQLTHPDARTVLLTPLDVLDPGTRYTAHVGAGIDDREGPIPPSSWQFTTGGRAPPALLGTGLLAHVRALAHDSMRGRRYATVDELKAAGYIRTEFERYGLAAYASGQWLQSFQVTGIRTSQNVIGVLRGEGALRDEWLVIGAHYDHVGVRNGQIHNGADDNASGTAGLLELARGLARQHADDGFGSDDRRSIMFIAFGMEEAGLIGSNFYCGHPWVPLGNVAAMLNLDMIGRLRDHTLYVIGEDTGREWSGLLRRYDDSFNYVAEGDAGTDYRCFKQNGRPVLSLFTGLHAEYHQPTDDTELIDVPGITAVSNLALGLAVNLAVRPRPLTK